MASGSTGALRRLPLREAIAALSTPGASGSSPLPSSLRKLTIRYLPKNSPAGAREFLKTIAPRIAYHNPSLPISVERIPDARGKSKNPTDRDAGVEWAEGKKPRHEMIIELNDVPATTVDVTDLSSSAIWETLLSTIRGDSTAFSAIPDPTVLPPSPDAPPPATQSSNL